MNTIHPYLEDLQVAENSFRVISLFMTWFLREERMAQDPQLGKWLVTLDEFDPVDMDEWGDFVRQAFLGAVLPPLRAILERPLTVSERLFLGAHLERFIENYRTRYPETT
jgi:hypothetical protein